MMTMSLDFDRLNACSKRRRAFTLIELMVSIAIISLLLAILLPSLSQARDRGRLTLCMSNLRGQGMALQNYTIDYQGAMPPRLTWNYFTISGMLINELLATHENEQFTPGAGAYSWKSPTGIWRCAEVVRDGQRGTHSGFLHHAPNRWLFDVVASFDGQQFKVLADAPTGWTQRFAGNVWRRIEHVRQPSEIVAIADNINYYHTPHMLREARESMGFGADILSEETGDERTSLRACHERFAKRPCVFVDGHVEALSSKRPFWQDALHSYHPKEQPTTTVWFYDQEVKRFMWFIGTEEGSSASPGG